MKMIEEIPRAMRGQLFWGVAWDSQLNISMSFGTIVISNYSNSSLERILIIELCTIGNAHTWFLDSARHVDSKRRL
jgi:hypothetical protein